MSSAETKSLALYRKRIINEFFPTRGFGKASFRVCRKAVSDFKKTNPSPENLGDLMLSVPEQACLYTDEYGDMDAAFYTAAENNFAAALKHLHEHRLIGHFRPRIIKIIETAQNCGYGFPDALAEIFEDFESRSVCSEGIERTNQL